MLPLASKVRLGVALLMFFSFPVGAQQSDSIESLIPAGRLSTIKDALPEVGSPALTRALTSTQTLWYDEEVMARSYQDSIGASSNDVWPDLVAASEDIIGVFHNRQKKQWSFPFSTTAGTDESTNLRVVNFVYWPHKNGQPETITITRVIRNDNRPAWTWTYRPGTMFGEVLFIEDGSNILPVEIRTRTRYENAWAMNVFRPFPRAIDLADKIKLMRPDWATTPNLKAMVDHLLDNSAMVPASLRAEGPIESTFRQDGFLDYLPDFGDDNLVRDLLRTTRFASAYDMSWKKDGENKVFAASTRSHGLSIVPVNYKAGLLQVTDEMCMRCHKETGRLLSEFVFDLYLYGEIWGKDSIFSFHPYDESRFPELRRVGVDNRSLNPDLRRMGLFRTSF